MGEKNIGWGKTRLFHPSILLIEIEHRVNFKISWDLLLLILDRKHLNPRWSVFFLFPCVLTFRLFLAFQRKCHTLLHSWQISVLPENSLSFSTNCFLWIFCALCKWFRGNSYGFFFMPAVKKCHSQRQISTFVSWLFLLHITKFLHVCSHVVFFGKKEKNNFENSS